MIKIFRTLILTSISAYVILLFLPFLDPFYLNQDEIDVLSWNNYGSVLPIPNWFAWVMFSLTILLAVGLFFFVAIARTIYLLKIAIFILLSPFMGLSTSTGLEVLIYQLINIADGAILVIAYLTNVSNQFHKA